MNRQELWLLEEKYNGEKSAGFFADCERLAAGEPLGYVIGHVPFLGCKIWLDSHPLIPRPETEFWTAHAIKIIKTALPKAARGLDSGQTPESERLVEMNRKDVLREASLRVLDLCAGSGAIGIAIAKHIPEAHVTFAEIDTTLLPTIAKNLAENSIPCTRHQVFQSDLFENIDGQFAVILSNPPYIDPALDRAEVSVKTHEPHRALYGGSNGLKLITRIIAEAPRYLTPQGELWLEHEPEQTATITRWGARCGFIVSTHYDQYHTERYSRLVLQ